MPIPDSGEPSPAVELQVNRAIALSRLGRLDDSRAAFRRVLEEQPDHLQAHLALYELEQAAGNRERALAHQRHVLATRRLFSHYAPRERRRVLALMAPGDFQANVPLDFVLDARHTTLHKLYLCEPADALPHVLPAAGVVFNAIAQSDANEPALAWAQTFVQHSGLPCINEPRRVRAMSRPGVAAALRGIPGSLAPPVERVPRADVLRAQIPFEYPLVIRPVESQAGRGLARVADRGELDVYLRDVEAEAYYVMPFLDLRLPDGYVRKYRIMFAGGEAYPYHLAISPRWMIHYYNAPMAENAWMREEEERFLREFETAFVPRHAAALAGIARAVGLEYFGIDCAVDQEERIVVFEADAAMIVHAADDPQIFSYKRPYAQAVSAALERLIDARSV